MTSFGVKYRAVAVLCAPWINTPTALQNLLKMHSNTTNEVVKVVWQKGLIAAVHVRFNCICQVAQCAPHLTHASLGQSESTTQTASRLVQCFCRAHDSHRQTDQQRLRYSVCNNRPHLQVHSTVMQPNSMIHWSKWPINKKQWAILVMFCAQRRRCIIDIL